MDVENPQSQAARIEALLQEVATFPEPQVRMQIEALLQALLNIYGEGLKRILEVIAQPEITGQALIERVASDGLVGALLSLHGLHPIDFETRLLRALEHIQPMVQSHGGTLEFVRLEDDGVAIVRLASGGCRGCQSSQATLRKEVEEALYSAVPDLDEIRIEGDAAPQQVNIPVKFLPPRGRKGRADTGASASRALPDQESGRIGVR